MFSVKGWLLLSTIALSCFSVPTYAQPKTATDGPAANNPMVRVSGPQTQAWLKSNPKLSSGFKSGGDATIKVVKPVTGGIMLSYDNAGGKGTVTVVGPPTILEEHWLGDIVNAMIDFGKKVVGKVLEVGGGGGGGGGSTNNNNGCVNVNFNSSVGNGTTIVVNGTSCPPA